MKKKIKMQRIEQLYNNFKFNCNKDRMPIKN